MSTMGHRVRVLPHSTFRLNLSVTAPYNADFDGDEMNMFVPQSYESMAEVKEIMAVPNQVVSPQSNRPVMGIVQDSLLGIMLFTRRDTFIEKHTVMNLMMWLGDSGKQLPLPAIYKPRPLWTGKQILSLVIPNVNLIRNLEGPTKTPSAQWCSPSDTVVVIYKGELISGYVNKSTAGSSQQGLVHIIWRDCGPSSAKNFLTRAQNVINQWLANHGFTVGVQDAIASKRTMQSITEKLNYYRGRVQQTIKRAEDGKLKFQPGKNLLESLEVEVNNELNKARDEAGQLAFKDLDPTNKIQNMVGAGSKGTNINISQIMGCVGQQNVEGKRIPFGFLGRSLPHFTKYDYGPESKGFVKSNYLCGLKPSEFFFHAMGGREGIIDTAVKTSETGYIQRRLVKALEDVMVKYDGTVRNSSEQVIQFLYGEDGMAAENIEDVRIDLLKLSNQELESKFTFMPSKTNTAQNKEYLRRSLDDCIVDDIIDNPSHQMQLMNELKQIFKDRDELRLKIMKNNEDQIRVPVNINRLIMNCDKEFSLKKNQPTNLSPIYVIEQINNLVKDLTVFPGRGPNSGAQFFSEANDNSTLLFKIYLRSELYTKRVIQQERMTQDSFDWLVGEIKSRFESSLVHPGEMVGSIAAHSLGEPATQMTLNTFHFAGVSSKNVTLGVPRLKEVINVAKTLKTPMISIYLDGQKKKSESFVMKVQGDIEHTTLGDLVDSTQIYYDPDPSKTVVKEDEMLLALYNEVPDANGISGQDINSPWLLRMKLNPKNVLSRFIDMEFINRRLMETFQDQIHVMNSDSNDENLVLRLRFRDLGDMYVPPEERGIREDQDEQDSAVQFLRQIEDSILHDLTLKGIPEITKVYAKKYNEVEYDPETGNIVQTNDNWMLETDGVALQKILTVDNVDYKKTVSNDILEVLKVLGIEAVRMSLINELRVVLNFYGIYVNYRHLSTLCDVMCQRGRLTSITRHGINRLDSGPLRKCSFEETVDIFLEAAAFGETDYLTGVTESIMLGQTAPLGTGSFELAIDQEILQAYAQTTIEEGLASGDTPLMEEHDNDRVFNYMTDYASKTPEYIRGGMTSEYCRTPAGGHSVYEALFSPRHQAMSPSYASPHYNASPASPNYQASPLYGYGGQKYQSPIYQGYASPIYQPGSDVISPNKITPNGAVINLSAQGGMTQSPNYSPNITSSHVNSPFQGEHRSYSPSYVGVGSKYSGNRIQHSPINSPSLAGNSPASPSYSPPPASVGMGSHHRSNANSPSYSPTVNRMGGIRGNMSSSSPNYSPTTPGGNYGNTGLPYQVKQNYSPSYSPTTTPQFVNQSPKYINNRVVTSSPKYSVGMGSDPHYQGQSSIGSPRSIHGAGSQHEGGGSSSYGPHDDSNSLKSSSGAGLYIPSSIPRYVPSSGNSPAYIPRSGSSEYGAVGGAPAASSGEQQPKTMYDPTATNNKTGEGQ